jgi:hypothetical protein
MVLMRERFFERAVPSAGRGAPGNYTLADGTCLMPSSGTRSGSFALKTYKNPA